MPTRKEIENLRLHKSDDLCALAELLGYKQTGRFAINQLQCNNGAFVSSLCHFLDDNPDAMEAIREWVLKHSDLEDTEEDDEECEDDILSNPYFGPDGIAG